MAPTPLPPRPEVLPLPADGFGSLAWWQSAIEAAEKVRDDLKDREWKPNMDAYRKPQKKDGSIPVNVDFYNTEQKKAQLFFRTPEMQLTAKRPEYNGAVPVFQAVVNEKIGPHEMNLAAAMDECLFDVLCPAGIFAVKIGYDATQDGTQTIPTGEMQPDPNYQPPVMPGAVLGLSQPAPAPMVPVTMDVPKIIHERYFIERVSPGAVLIPASFHGSDYDKAPMKGWRFVEDLTVAKRKGWVPQNFTGTGEDKYRLTDDPDKGSREVVVGVEIWYLAHRFDPTCKHPELYRQLILIDGLPQPAVHRNSPYQRFDPHSGKLIAGMRGSPLHVGAIRYVADSAFPPSDCTISRAQVDELGAYRGQMQNQRSRSLSMRWFDRNRVAPEDIDRLKRGDTQALWPVDGNGEEIIGEVARAEYPRENFSFMQVIQSDINKEWALSENTAGQTDKGDVSATESSIIQNNVAVRQDYERTKLAGHVVKIVEKAASLIQLFADQEDYVEVLGPDGNKRLEAWDKTRVQGQFVYSLKPDSAQRIDAAADRKQFNDYMNFNAKNPFVNLMELTRIGATKNNLDPALLIKQPEAPSPPPPNISYRFSGADLAIPEVRQILAQAGIQLPSDPSPEVTAAALAEKAKGQPHGGPAEKGEQLSKRASDQTGQNAGAGLVPSQATVQ